MCDLDIRRLGLVSYADALAMQRALVEERKAGTIPDTLLLLEHPHVLTLGVKGDGGREHILASPQQLEELGVEVFEAGRGGDVTYHGIGQVVGYPIVDLKPDRQDVHRYVRDLEEVMIRACADFGVTAGRIKGLSGTWVEPVAPDLAEDARQAMAEKIGAIGIRVSRWVTSHGFAFNVNTDLDFFKLIVPCGIADHGVTSLQRLIGRSVDQRLVEDHLARHFTEVWGQVSTINTPGASARRVDC